MTFCTPAIKFLCGWKWYLFKVNILRYYFSCSNTKQVNLHLLSTLIFKKLNIITLCCTSDKYRIKKRRWWNVFIEKATNLRNYVQRDRLAWVSKEENDHLLDWLSTYSKGQAWNMVLSRFILVVMIFIFRIKLYLFSFIMVVDNISNKKKKFDKIFHESVSQFLMNWNNKYAN